MKYEEAIKELENIIEKLEDGKTPLDEASQCFDRGVELVKFCNSQLKSVKGKVKVIREELDSLIEEEE